MTSMTDESTVQLPAATMTASEEPSPDQSIAEQPEPTTPATEERRASTAETVTEAATDGHDEPVRQPAPPFVHEITHLLDCIVNNKDVAPFGATFNDGYRAAVICDAILQSAAAKKQVDLKY